MGINGDKYIIVVGICALLGGLRGIWINGDKYIN